MTQENIRTELAKLGVIISMGNIPIFSTEAPIQMQSLETVGPCSIGAFTYGSNLFLHYARVGRYCSIGQDVSIGLGNHRTDLFSTHPLAVKGGSQFAWHDQFRTMCDSMMEGSERRDHRPKTVIGNDVWLGRGVLVNDDVNIGDGAIIGAGAVVTKDIPSYAVAVGVPANIIRFRFSEEIIGRFLRLRWWDLDLASLKNIPPEPIEFLNKMEEAVASGEIGKLSIASINIGPKPQG